MVSGSQVCQVPQGACQADAALNMDVVVQKDNIPYWQRQQLASAPPAVQKHMIAEWLHVAISGYKPADAGLLTGLLMELDNEELLQLLNSQDKLMKKIDEVTIDEINRRAGNTGAGGAAAVTAQGRDQGSTGAGGAVAATAQGKGQPRDLDDLIRGFGGTPGGAAPPGDAEDVEFTGTVKKIESARGFGFIEGNHKHKTNGRPIRILSQNT